jgi:hypothetical protein
MNSQLFGAGPLIASNDGTCVFCLQHVEAIDHLILGCVYSREIWFLLLRKCGWPNLAPAAEEGIADWWLRSWELIPKLCHVLFDSLVLLIARTIWLERSLQ